MTIKISRKPDPSSIQLLGRLVHNWKYANHILNFGRGRWPELTKDHLTNYHGQTMTVTNYDPNSKAKSVISDLSKVHDKVSRFDVVICANVLNACEDLDATLLDLAKIDFDVAVIQIDEGQGEAKRGHFHRHELVADYIPKIQQYFHRFDITLHRGVKCITVSKGKRYFHLVDINDGPLVPEAEIAPKQAVSRTKHANKPNEAVEG